MADEQTMTREEIEEQRQRDLIEDLRQRLAHDDEETLAQWIDQLGPGDIVRVITQLSREEQDRLLQTLDPADAADVIDDLPDAQSADLLEHISPEVAAAIIEELDSDDRADVLGEMEEDEALAVLKVLPAEEAEEARELLSYPGDTAGGVMLKEYVAYTLGTTVGQVLDDLLRHREEYSYYDVRYFYVTDRDGVLKGVLRLRDMVLSSPNRPIEEVMIANPTTAQVDLDLATLQHMFETHSYSALPVVDREGHLLGIVIEKEVAEAARKNANRMMLKLAGIFGGEELRSMPLRQRAWGRLSWLLVILVLSLLAASVIKLFEGTLRVWIGLAMFLPVVAGMSGSSGNQAMALSLREMALGVIKPWDLMYVVLKEMKVGLVNGMVLGLLLAWMGYLVTNDPRQGMLLGSALALNTVIAVCLGGTLPLVLKKLRLDPAAASGPILTTVVDTGGFFLVLCLAWLFLQAEARPAQRAEPPEPAEVSWHMAPAPRTGGEEPGNWGDAAARRDSLAAAPLRRPAWAGETAQLTIPAPANSVHGGPKPRAGAPPVAG